jgi:hypothetical protein
MAFIKAKTLKASGLIRSKNNKFLAWGKEFDDLEEAGLYINQFPIARDAYMNKREEF